MSLINISRWCYCSRNKCEDCGCSHLSDMTSQKLSYALHYNRLQRQKMIWPKCFITKLKSFQVLFSMKSALLLSWMSKYPASIVKGAKSGLSIINRPSLVQFFKLLEGIVDLPSIACLFKFSVGNLLSYFSFYYCLQHPVSRSDYNNVIGALPYLKVNRKAE